jgi:CheY-like chemotaxis protein
MNSKILIVDDDPLGAITLESIFSDQPYQFISVQNGPVALAIKYGLIDKDL